MLARTTMSLPQSQCAASLTVRALPLPLHHGRTLLVPKASYSEPRSSSPRSESWRSSWRTELEHGSNGNGNGTHAHDDDRYQTAYLSNGSGYYEHHYEENEDDGTRWGAQQAGWQHREDDDEDAEAPWNSWRSGRGVEDSGSGDAEDSPARAGGDDDSDGQSAEDGAGGFFTGAFKEALKAALQRSPLYADDASVSGSADEENVEPQPYENEAEVYDRPIFTDQFRLALKESFERQQAQLDAYGGYGSDDDTPGPYTPAPPPRCEMSPIEEVIATALGASQLHLRRLNLMKNEIDAAIERETKQIERLDFALHKSQSDIAYYKSLERMLEEERRNREARR